MIRTLLNLIRNIRPDRFRRDKSLRILQLERQLGSLRQECRRAEMRERERIACRLHDDIGPLIFLIRLKLGELRCPSQPQPDGVLDELSQLVKQAAETARSLTHELGASLVGAALLPSLQGIAQELTRRSGIAVALEVPHAGFCLPEPQRSVACRTVRELCLNAQKHASARRVSIGSRVSAGWLWIDVQDDGQGLGVPALRTWRASPDGGFGLASAQAQLRALGGDLQLRSRPGRGTCARLMLPLKVA